jgi:hypothetical protein
MSWLVDKVPEEAAQPIMEAPNGPWTRLVSAKWGVYPLTIYQNPDRVLLATLFDVAEGEPKGMVVLMRRVLVVEGDLSRFIAAQTRELALVEKVSSVGKLSYLFVASTPKYVSYNAEEFENEVKKQYGELSGYFSSTNEALTGYGLKAKDLLDASDEQVQSLLGDPYVLLALLNPQAAPSRTPMAIPKFLLGKGLTGESIDLNLENLASCAVIGGEREQRLHAMHVLLEGAMQSNVPCVVFDASKAFSGMAVLGKNVGRLQEFKMPPRSVNFPFKAYELGKTLFVDPSLISGDSFLKAFALENSDVAAVMKQVYDEKRRDLSSLNDLVAALGNAKESKEAPQYIINKAVRVASVLQRSHQGLFGKVVTPELFTPWQESMGRVFYVDVSSVASQQLRHLVLSSILEAIPLPPTNELRLLLAFEQDAGEIAAEVALVQKRFSGRGIGFMFQASTDGDVPLKEPKLKLEVVGNEVVATEFGQKPKRLAPRPTYTECSELLMRQIVSTVPSLPKAPEKGPAGQASPVSPAK